jgi:type II secretory pathway pseudopilin PulG
MYTEQQELISKMAAIRWMHWEREMEEKKREQEQLKLMKLEQEQLQLMKLEQLIRLQEAKKQNITQQKQAATRLRAASAPLKRYHTPGIPSSNGWMSNTDTPAEFDDSLNDAQEASSALDSSCCTEILSPGYTAHSLLEMSDRTGNFLDSFESQQLAKQLEQTMHTQQRASAAAHRDEATASSAASANAAACPQTSAHDAEAGGSNSAAGGNPRPTSALSRLVRAVRFGRVGAGIKNWRMRAQSATAARAGGHT